MGRSSHAWRAAWLSGLLLTLVAHAGAAGDEQPAPSSLEDVVRWHVTGVPDDELVQRIRRATVAFELSPELLAELRRAGLSEAVLQALRQRRDSVGREGGAPAGSRCLGEARLRVVLRTGSDAPEARRVRIPDEVPPELAGEWHLAARERFEDVAIFVGCRTPAHVPDQWTFASPLADARPQLPRHGILAFAPAARWEEASFLRRFGIRPWIAAVPERTWAMASLTAERTRGGVLEYEIPEVLEVAVEPGEHDLSVGIALLAGERYRAWSVSALDGVVVPTGGLELVAEVEGSRRPNLERLAIAFRAPGAQPSGARWLVTRGRGCPVR